MNRPTWSAIPAARSSAPVLKIRLAVVLGALLLAAAAGIFSSIAWLSAPATSAASSGQADGLAAIIAWDFVTGHTPAFTNTTSPAVVPANLLTKPWTPLAGTLLGAPIQRNVTDTTSAGRTIETHQFYVVTSQDNTDRAFYVTVSIDVTSTGAFSLVSMPKSVAISPSF
jgi:hypothetical protein